MDWVKTSLRHAPSAPTSKAEMAALRRKAWREQAVLSVSVKDDRLDWAQRQFLAQIGARLYGPREV